MISGSGLLRLIWKQVSKIGNWPVDKKALATTLAAMALLCAYRFYDLWTTGFVVSDEYGYIYYAMHPQAGNPLYGDRLFFSSVNIALFRILGIGNFTSFALFLPFYLLFWGGLTIIAFYKIMKILGYGGSVVAISLLSSLFIVNFDLLSLGFLTEPVGLAMATLGIYFVVKFVKARRRLSTLWIYPTLASLSFTAASFTREPYGVFILAGFIPVAFAAADRWLNLSGKEIRFGLPNRKVLAAVLVLGVVSFQGTGAYLQQQSGTSLTAQVNGAATDLVQALAHPLVEVSTPVRAVVPATYSGAGGPKQTASYQAPTCPASWTSASLPNTVLQNATQTSSATVTTTTTTTSTLATSTSTQSTTAETTATTTATTSTSVTSTSTQSTTAETTATTTTTTTSISVANTSTTTTTSSTSTATAAATSTTTSSTTAQSTAAQTASTEIGTTSSASAAPLNSTKVVLSPRIADTAAIFVTGLFLGWGPVIPLITALGCAVLLVSALRKRSLEMVTLLALAVLALGSYLGVAFIFSSQPGYLTFDHFSTLLRFSDTAIPAYFVAAPAAFSVIIKKRRYLLPVVVALLLTLTAVPLYQSYAASNLGVSQDPFLLSYRTPGVVVRDYITSVQNDPSFVVLGLGQGIWWWTPGSAWIGNVTLSPYLTYKQLLSHGWSTFYVLGDGSSEGTYCELHAVLPYGITLGQFSVISEQKVADQDGYSIVKVQLQWKSH